MFNYFSTSQIFSFLNILIKFLNSIFFIFLLIGISFALVFSPPDYLQGENVRIMYIHVPAAWISLAAFCLIAFLSVINFTFKIKHTLLISKSIAPIGLLFACLAIITGSIWGQPTWGTWWVWDARLTSMLVLCLFYLAYILSFKIIKNNHLSMKVSSFISILGVINVPIIKYSVDWWATLHQPASIKLDGTSSIHASMLTPLLLMLLVLLTYSALIFLMKYKTEIIKMKKKSLKKYD